MQFVPPCTPIFVMYFSSHTPDRSKRIPHGIIWSLAQLVTLRVLGVILSHTPPYFCMADRRPWDPPQRTPPAPETTYRRQGTRVGVVGGGPYKG